MRALRIVLLVLVLVSVLATGLMGVMAAKQAFDPKTAQLISDLEGVKTSGIAKSTGMDVIDLLKSYRFAGYAGAASIAVAVALFVSSFTTQSRLIWVLAACSILTGTVAMVVATGADRIGLGAFTPREQAITYAVPLMVAAVLAVSAELCRLRTSVRAR